MNRLNCFNPYQSKPPQYEDQLTRAYLVLLKYSSHAFFTFIDYVRSKHETSGNEEPISIIEFLEEGWDIETQKGNPQINTDALLSILITDSEITAADLPIQSKDRNAIYDGLITFGSKLTMVIDNKPRSGNVWFGQLNPSGRHLSEDTTVYPNSAKLEWKEIIKQLNHLLTVQTIAGYEKLMIDDFVSYIDEYFPFLNPYDSFHQCKGNPELLKRRINTLLKSLAADDSMVQYHQPSGSYYIQTRYSQIERICLGLTGEGAELSILLALCFGDTQRQATSFYKSNLQTSHLNNTKWSMSPNFENAHDIRWRSLHSN